MPISFKEFVDQSGGNANQAQVLNKDNVIKPVSTREPNYLQRVYDQYTQSGQNIVSDIESSTSVKDMVGVPLRAAGEVAKSAFAPISEIPIVKGATNLFSKGVEKLSETKPIQSIGEALQPLAEIALRYSEEHPKEAKNIESLVNLALLAVGNKTPVNKAALPTVGKGIEKGLGGVSGTGSALKTLGEKAYGITVTAQEPTVRALVAYDKLQPTFMGRIKNMLTGVKSQVGTKPITEANTAARQGVAGTEYQIGVQSAKIADDLWKNAIQPKLASVKKAVDMRQFISDLENQIKRVPELGRRADLKDALNAFKEEYKNVGVVSAEKLQQYKEGWAKFIPEKSYSGKPIGSAYKEIQDMAAAKARSIIYPIVGEDGKLAYFDYGNLKSITESGIKSVLSDPAKKSLFRNVWQGFMDMAITPVVTSGGKILYKTGKGLEFIGEAGAKKVRDIIK